MKTLIRQHEHQWSKNRNPKLVVCYVCLQLKTNLGRVEREDLLKPRPVNKGSARRPINMTLSNLATARKNLIDELIFDEKVNVKWFIDNGYETEAKNITHLIHRAEKVG